MTWRVIHADLMRIRKSWVTYVSLGLALVGPVFLGVFAWSIHELSSVGVNLPMSWAFRLQSWKGFLMTGGGFVIVPVSLALVIAGAYLFGREYQEQTIEVTLCSGRTEQDLLLVRMAEMAVLTLILGACSFMSAVMVGSLLGLRGDLGEVWLLGLSSMLVRSATAFSIVPALAWLALRWRGVITPLALGVAFGLLSLSLRESAVAGFLPLSAPSVAFSANHEFALGVSEVVFLSAFAGLGLAAAIREARYWDPV